MKRITISWLALLMGLGTSLLCAATSTKKELRFTIPQAPWILLIDGDNVEVKSQQVKPEGSSGYFLLEDNKNQLNISFFIESARKCNDSKSCRDFVWKSNQPQLENPKNVAQSEIGGISILEYLLPAYKGIPVQQYNMYAEYVVDGFWVDLHLSKVLYKPADRPLFENVVKSVHFEPKPGNPAPTAATPDHSSTVDSSPSIDPTWAYVTEGNGYYLKRDFVKAIGPYQKALDREKKESTLEKDWWHVLIDNLGMCYGMTGDMKKAKETFEYGLSKDDRYPLFYYNLACTYAEMDDLDNTISFLKRAFQYKDNVIAGEQMPHPEEDSSFQRFMKNDRFLAALKEIHQP
ncbi:MAG: tetratricopeptide repeat protein [Acidobacteriia bacterium]|nr:tetratricopeptide repeat protein [Terriglobia bacterium]